MMVRSTSTLTSGRVAGSDARPYNQNRPWAAHSRGRLTSNHVHVPSAPASRRDDPGVVGDKTRAVGGAHFDRAPANAAALEDDFNRGRAQRAAAPTGDRKPSGLARYVFSYRAVRQSPATFFTFRELNQVAASADSGASARDWVSSGCRRQNVVEHVVEDDFVGPRGALARNPPLVTSWRIWGRESAVGQCPLIEASLLAASTACSCVEPGALLMIACNAASPSWLPCAIAPGRAADGRGVGVGIRVEPLCAFLANSPGITALLLQRTDPGANARCDRDATTIPALTTRAGVTVMPTATSPAPTPASSAMATQTASTGGGSRLSD